jgi:hypothetical protein
MQIFSSIPVATAEWERRENMSEREREREMRGEEDEGIGRRER